MNDIKEKYSVLIPDGNSKILMVAINCLSQNKDLKIYVILSTKYTEIARSKNISKLFFHENLNKNNEISWINNINSIVEKYDIDIIMPIDVSAIRCLSKNKKHIKDLNKLGLLPSLESLNKADNKGSLSKHLTINNLPAPKTFLFTKGEICEESPIGFPIIIKLLEDCDGGGEGIQMFSNEESLRQYFLNNIVANSYLIQNYIEGYDIDCSVLCKNGKILAFTIQKGTMKGVSDFVPQLGVEFLFENDLYVVVEKLMESLNWSGVAHIDMRYDKNEKKFKIIEINPRYWESLDASLIAGVNFTYFYCLASKGVMFEVPKYNNVKFLNLVGLSKTIKHNKLFLFNLKFICNNTPLRFFIKDPLPLMYIIFYKIRKQFLRKI